MEVTPRLHSHFVLAVFTGMVAAFQSERWPFSKRKGGRFRPEYAPERWDKDISCECLILRVAISPVYNDQPLVGK